MVVSAPQAAKRTLVKLLLVFASVYSVVLEGFSREAPDNEVLKAFKKVLLKAHPDKGGSKRLTGLLV